MPNTAPFVVIIREKKATGVTAPCSVKFEEFDFAFLEDGFAFAKEISKLYEKRNDESYKRA